MFDKHYKFFFLPIVPIVIVLSFFWLAYGRPNYLLEVNFFDVGQGDAILIKSPYGQNILIDGGQDKTILSRLAENMDFADKQIDLIILTHPHDDHVSGLVDVIKQYEVKKIIYTGVVHTGPNYLAWLDLIREKEIPLTIIDRPQTIKFGENCELEILYPLQSIAGKDVDNLNNSSMAVKLVYGETKFLFAGDMEAEVEAELLANRTDLAADVLKVGHHGSNTSTSGDFLQAVMPEIAFISAGKDNGFGHPSLRVLKRLERAGVKIYRSDLDGTAKITSDGSVVSVK